MPTDVTALVVSTTRRRVARILMGLAATSALAAAVAALAAVTDADAPTLMAETWRLFGFLTFAGLFALLGWRPLSYPGLWEIVILNKLLLTVTAGGYAAGVLGPGDVDGAVAALGWDGGLTIVLLAAYASCRGWHTWLGWGVDAGRASSHPRDGVEVSP